MVKSGKNGLIENDPSHNKLADFRACDSPERVACRSGVGLDQGSI